MRIGIDLGPLVPEECGGIAPLLQGVLGSLFADHPEHEFILFATEAGAGLFPTVPDHVERRILPRARFCSSLSRQAGRGRLDVLFRSFPLDEPAGLSWSRQVVLVPDLQHEFFP